MMLDGIVDAVPYSTSAEDRQRGRGSSDEVFEQFAKLCDAAGPTKCKLAGHPGQTTAQRVDQLLERVRTSPIPAPKSDPPGELSYGDALFSSFSALRDPALWPDWAEKLNAAADGDGSALLTDGRLWRTRRVSPRRRSRRPSPVSTGPPGSRSAAGRP